MLRKSTCVFTAMLLCGIFVFGIAGSPKATATASATIKVTSLSTSNCYPLTPLTLKVSGLKASTAITVRFKSRPSGRLIASEAPLSVKGSTIVVAVPLVLSSAGALSHGSATLTISQGTRTSVTRTIIIAPLPTDTTYGTQPGEISKYFLDLQASLLGERLDELEAVGAEYGIDTTSAQETLNSLLNGTLLSLNDVNRIIVDPTTVIDGPTTSSGETPVVDEQFIETMDQIYGAYLVNAFGSTSSGSLRPRLFAPSALRVIIGSIKNAASVNDAKEILESAGDNIWLQYTAVATGAAALLHEATNNKYLGQIAEALPIGVGLYNIGLAMENEGFTVADMVRASYQGDVQSYAADEAQLQTESDELLKVSVDGLITGLTNKMPEAVQLILDLSTPLVGSTSQLLYGAGEILGLAPQEYSADEEFLTLGKAIDSGPPQGTGFGLIQGQAQITSDAGVGAALDSTQLCCLSSNDEGINGMVDPDGSYELWYPLGVPDTNYSSLTLNVYDFVGNFNVSGPFTALAWEDLNLQSPVSGQATVAPTLSGVCNDTDWQDPDGDDPDCD